MKTLTIPEGYQCVMPYLIVENAIGFLEFTKVVFGAEEKYKAMRDEKIIQHAEITIGGSVIMFTDATVQYAGRPGGFFIYVADCDDVYEKALTNGATSIAAPADQAYGRSAGIEDAFSNTWWITSVAQVS
jgi:PhnB protein